MPGKVNICGELLIKIAYFDINIRRTSLILGCKSRFYISEQVGMLF